MPLTSVGEHERRRIVRHYYPEGDPDEMRWQMAFAKKHGLSVSPYLTKAGRIYNLWFGAMDTKKKAALGAVLGVSAGLVAIAGVLWLLQKRKTGERRYAAGVKDYPKIRKELEPLIGENVKITEKDDPGNVMWGRMLDVVKTRHFGRTKDVMVEFVPNEKSEWGERTIKKSFNSDSYAFELDSGAEYSEEIILHAPKEENSYLTRDAKFYNPNIMQPQNRDVRNIFFYRDGDIVHQIRWLVNKAGRSAVLPGEIVRLGYIKRKTKEDLNADHIYWMPVKKESYERHVKRNYANVYIPYDPEMWRSQEDADSQGIAYIRLWVTGKEGKISGPEYSEEIVLHAGDVPARLKDIISKDDLDEYIDAVGSWVSDTFGPTSSQYRDAIFHNVMKKYGDVRYLSTGNAIVKNRYFVGIDGYRVGGVVKVNPRTLRWTGHGVNRGRLKPSKSEVVIMNNMRDDLKAAEISIADAFRPDRGEYFEEIVLHGGQQKKS